MANKNIRLDIKDIIKVDDAKILPNDAIYVHDAIPITLYKYDTNKTCNVLSFRYNFEKMYMQYVKNGGEYTIFEWLTSNTNTPLVMLTDTICQTIDEINFINTVICDIKTDYYNPNELIIEIASADINTINTYYTYKIVIQVDSFSFTINDTLFTNCGAYNTIHNHSVSGYLFRKLKCLIKEKYNEQLASIKWDVTECFFKLYNEYIKATTKVYGSYGTKNRSINKLLVDMKLYQLSLFGNKSKWLTFTYDDYKNFICADITFNVASQGSTYKEMIHMLSPKIDDISKVAIKLFTEDKRFVELGIPINFFRIKEIVMTRDWLLVVKIDLKPIRL